MNWFFSIIIRRQAKGRRKSESSHILFCTSSYVCSFEYTSVISSNSGSIQKSVNEEEGVNEQQQQELSEERIVVVVVW